MNKIKSFFKLHASIIIGTLIGFYGTQAFLQNWDVFKEPIFYAMYFVVLVFGMVINHYVDKNHQKKMAEHRARIQAIRDRRKE